MCPLLCLKLFMIPSHLNKIDIQSSGFCTGTDFKIFSRGLKSLASHLSEIYRCFFCIKLPPQLKLWGCPVQLSTGFTDTGCLYGSVEQPACFPVQVQTPRTTETFHSLLSFQLSCEIWIYLLFLWPCVLCVVFVFIFIKTSLYIIYLVLEHGKHLGQLQLLLNVLWNNQEYERELQTAHVSFRTSAVWIYTLSVREGQQCKATNVEPFQWPFFWLQSCRLVQYLCQLVENLVIALRLTCLWLIDSWGSYHFSTVFHFNLIKMKFEI